jgi:AcrR family transcriptional regulator
MGDKSQLIICAAREAFLEKGYDGVSMDEVANRAGVAKQTVYARYASKDALFLAVVDSVQGKMLSAISAAELLPIRDRLQRIARELLDVVLDHFDPIAVPNWPRSLIPLSDSGALDLWRKNQGIACNFG